MYKTLSVIAIAFLLSCSNNDSACEQKLEMIMNSTSMPLDLPQAPSVQNGIDESILIIEITAEDKYVLDGDLFEYENLERVIYNLIGTPELESEKIKIKGHPSAHYESVFRLIEFCKTNNISPILVYKDE